MLSTEDIMQLIQSLIWLLAGVGVFIVGMNFMSEALERSAGEGMKRLLGRISNNRFSGVGIGAGVTAIIQSSSATSVMVIGLVNAGVMTLMQATPIIMGANIGTTITGVLVALKNDYFNMLMYLFAFAGVMMGFFKKEKIKIAGLLCSGLGLIFVGQRLNRTGGGRYVERSGNIINENGNMGVCYTDVYRLTEEGFQQTFSAALVERTENLDDEYVSTYEYYLGDIQVEEDAYQAGVEAAFDPEGAQRLGENAVPYDSITQMITDL